jgi:ATP-dependent Clp protease ATP-binding subunit ClpA
LEGLLKEDAQLFNLLLPEKPNVVTDLQTELATWREATPSSNKKSLPLSPTAIVVVAAAAAEQQRLGHKSVATQHLLLAILTTRTKASSWFRNSTELPTSKLLSKHGITAELTEEKQEAALLRQSLGSLTMR